MSIVRYKIKPWFLAMLAMVVTFISIWYWMLSVSERGVKVPVVVAVKDLKVPSRLSEKDFVVKDISREMVPRNAVISAASVSGMTLLFPLAANEILTINHVTKKVDANSESLLVSKDFFGFSLPADWFSARPAKVSGGDKIILLASAPGRTVDKGTTMLSADPVHVLKADYDRDGLPTRLLLDVNPVQAGNILQAHANNLNLALLILPSAALNPSRPAVVPDGTAKP